jgi:hypothetical protein
LSALIALWRYDRIVPLFLSTKPEVQYVIESFAILTDFLDPPLSVPDGKFGVGV